MKLRTALKIYGDKNYSRRAELTWALATLLRACARINRSLHAHYGAEGPACVTVLCVCQCQLRNSRTLLGSVQGSLHRNRVANEDVMLKAKITDHGTCEIVHVELKTARPESAWKAVSVYAAIVLVYLLGMKLVQGC